MKKDSSRRSFLQKAGIAGLALPLSGFEFTGDATLSRRMLAAQPKDIPAAGPAKIAVFSKSLQWTEVNQMADLVAEAGLDGVDLTVRPGGHVEPERVKDELPLVAEAMKKAGKEIVMITTAIGSAGEPYAKDIISTAGQLGIGYYRMNWLKYDSKRTIEENLALCKDKLEGLADLNKTHKIKAGYQNHAGASFGSPIWDLALILREIDSPWVGSQYDIRHAVVEGANSWPLGFDCISAHINSLAVKDFYWGKNNGKWKTVNVPLGEGMVDFDAYFKKVKTLEAGIPLTLHMEYELGGAQHGHRQADITPEQMVAVMKKDMAFLRRFV